MSSLRDYIQVGQLVFDIMFRLVEFIATLPGFYSIDKPAEKQYLHDTLNYADIYLATKCALEMCRHVLDNSLAQQGLTRRNQIFLAEVATFAAWGQYSDIKITDKQYSKHVLGHKHQDQYINIEDWIAFAELLPLYCSPIQEPDNAIKKFYVEGLVKLAEPFGDDSVNFVYNIFDVMINLEEYQKHEPPKDKYMHLTQRGRVSNDNFETP
jgi:hypothetical protein